MKLIMQGELSLTEIALRVGYDSYQHYKKMFQEVRKETPKDFRRAFEASQTEEN